MTTSEGKSLFHLVFLFWIVMDSLGTLPIFVSLLKHFPPAKQRRIIIRELVIALVIMIVFLFFGHGFFQLLHITHSSLQMAGGVILFLLAIRMILSMPGVEKKERVPKDPLIVPLAVPSIAGPGILATITLYGGGMANNLTVLLAIVIAWAFSLPLLLFSPFLNRIFGENGIIATERLFGYILVLISTQMAFSGLISALKT
jgi:multiple antibiotic resistance protein